MRIEFDGPAHVVYDVEEQILVWDDIWVFGFARGWYVDGGECEECNMQGLVMMVLCL